MRDIQPFHFEAFLNEKSKNCTDATMKNYLALGHKLSKIINEMYGCETNWDVKELPKGQKGEKLRTQMMSNEHLDILINHAKGKKSDTTYKILMLSRTFGLRSEETSKIRGTDIKKINERYYVDVVGKGGRYRRTCCVTNTPTSEEKEFLEKCMSFGDEKIVGIKPKSVCESINRAMTKCNLKQFYPQTGCHAIRKNFSTNLYQSLINGTNGFDKLDEERAKSYVSVALGHGESRKDVFETYVHLK